jgi:uncharacterized membrane protein
MNMALEYPGDSREALVRSGRNISDAERWASIAAGAALAVYGIRHWRRNGWMHATMGALLCRWGVTGHCELYEALGINTAATRSDTRRALGGRNGILVEESITINRPVQELYRFWRHLENLPRFMQHLESVERLTDTISRWRAKGPAGVTVEWNAEVINEIPNKLIAWRSLEGADVVSAGSVHVDDAGPGRGTRIRVRLQYNPVGGMVSAAIAKLMGADPEQQIREDLGRFKQLMEAGEIARTDAEPRG